MGLGIKVCAGEDGSISSYCNRTVCSLYNESFFRWKYVFNGAGGFARISRICVPVVNFL